MVEIDCKQVPQDFTIHDKFYFDQVEIENDV
jgi:hypothetical protein